MQTSGPESCGAGSDPDKEVGEEGTTRPDPAGEIPVSQERPSERAELVIILRPLSAAD